MDITDVIFVFVISLVCERATKFAIPMKNTKCFEKKTLCRPNMHQKKVHKRKMTNVQDKKTNIHTNTIV